MLFIDYIFSKEHIRDGPCENGQVEPEGLAIDIVDIESFTALPGDVIASTDLRQAGHSRSHGQFALFRFRVKTNLIGLVRPGTNQAHFAEKNMDQLRKFIQTGSSQKAADWGHSGILGAGPSRSVAIIESRCVFVHSAELEQFERAAM